MQKSTWLAASLAALLFIAIPPAPAQADVAVSFSFFHDNLAPHGRWVTVGSYGRCWYPVGVPAGWQPYTVGHWGWGDYGWTWISADPWGDWTYRYGSWTFQPPWGWVWVPGYVWAPAWVTWSYSDAYIGWAPIPPTFSFAVGGYFGSPVVVSRNAYCFVPRRRFAAIDVHAVRVPVHENRTILAHSRHVTRFDVSRGIVRNEGLELRSVERSSAAKIQRVRASEARVAPARIEKAGTKNRRVSVAAPATTRTESRRVVREESVRRETRDTRKTDVRREPAAKPRRESAPDVRRAPEARRTDVRESAPSSGKSRASRPSDARGRNARPSESNARRPARSEPRSSVGSTSREKSKAVRSSSGDRASRSTDRRPRRGEESRRNRP
jgi:hypothetical protein